MTEDQGASWLAAEGVPRETIDRIALFVDMILHENRAQNLISQSSMEDIWGRHIVDSAQLYGLANSSGEAWLDIGSGPGLPGIVIALLGAAHVTLVEPRRRRVEFLHTVLSELGLSDRVDIAGCRIERTTLPRMPSAITARAFASLSATFAAAEHLALPETSWILPKGRGAIAELETARETWQGVFHVEQSVTDPNSMIVIARNVRRRNKR